MKVDDEAVESAKGEFFKISAKFGAILLPEEDGFRKMVAYKAGSRWIWINQRFIKRANGKNNKKKV
jgi:hypothetical protein